MLYFKVTGDGLVPEGGYADVIHAAVGRSSVRARLLEAEPIGLLAEGFGHYLATCIGGSTSREECYAAGGVSVQQWVACIYITLLTTPRRLPLQ